MSAFEPKINNENLTKCLQSLKEMYQDLHNRGETCPCEPEFRGYSVLLNLNKGDILREVQQLQESVRNSAEVKFALQVFSAFNSTNYVRFFRLVRSSSYLNSCILHGYFGQYRYRHRYRAFAQVLVLGQMLLMLPRYLDDSCDRRVGELQDSPPAAFSSFSDIQ
ncbi:hypothetical protein AB205_0070780, partial [Aquarana catesbeiana]